MADDVGADVLVLTAKIVSAHIGNNEVPGEALPSLIQAVYHSLATAGTVEAPPEVQVPAAPVKKSVFPDFIICLEDGKKVKMLTRYLKTRYGMTPNEYRAKWNLPGNYPMIAPSYASQRSALAKSLGLGGKRVAKPAEPAEPAEPAVKMPLARRARESKG